MSDRGSAAPSARRGVPRGLAWLWGLVCGFMLILWGHELWVVMTHPEDYARLWGGEGPLAVWYYASEAVYLVHLAGLLLWFLAGLGLGFGWLRRRPWLLPGHVALSLLWAVPDCL